jgi:hypothetical protein
VTREAELKMCVAAAKGAIYLFQLLIFIGLAWLTWKLVRA